MPPGKGGFFCTKIMKSKKYFTPKKECYEYKGTRLIIDTSTARGREMRDTITAQAWSRDEGVCGICKRYVCLLDAVGDHIKPRGMGGATRDDSVENIQAVHPEFNMQKGSIRDFHLTP